MLFALICCSSERSWKCTGINSLDKSWQKKHWRFSNGFFWKAQLPCRQITPRKNKFSGLTSHNRNTYTVSIVRRYKLDTRIKEMETIFFDNKKWLKDCTGAMAKMGYSFRTLSKKLPVSHATLHRILSGKKDVEMMVFIAICYHLELSPLAYFDENEFQLRMFWDGTTEAIHNTVHIWWPAREYQFHRVCTPV